MSCGGKKGNFKKGRRAPTEPFGWEISEYTEWVGKRLSVLRE